MMRYLLIGIMVLVLGNTEAWAQLESSTKTGQRAANRKALRDARRFDARYKESHLAVSRAELRPGAAGRQAASPPQDSRANYKFDRAGEPRVSEPSRIRLRPRKTQNAAPLQ